MEKYRIEVFIKREFLTVNEIANGNNIIERIAIGTREKHEILNYILLKGISKDEGTVLETVFPIHCIERILIADLSKITEANQ